MSDEVQMDGAAVERRLLKLMQSVPVGGKYNPLVLSAEGEYKASDDELEQFTASNTHRSLEQMLSGLVVLYLRVRRLRLDSAIYGLL